MSPNAIDHAADIPLLPSSHETVRTKAPKGSVDWFWTPAREKAAKLVAEDDLTDDAIAAECKVARRSLATWKLDAGFQAKVKEHRAVIRERILNSRYCLVENRVKVREQLIDGFIAIAKERAARPEMQDGKVAGGKSGLVALQPRIIGTGDNAKSFIEQIPDTALAAEIRTGLKELAQDVGQFIAKTELSGPGGKPLEAATVNISLADYRKMVAIANGSIELNGNVISGVSADQLEE